jgi:hypothetical protein
MDASGKQAAGGEKTRILTDSGDDIANSEDDDGEDERRYVGTPDPCLFLVWPPH